MAKLRVAVLMGGTSHERAVSLNSGTMVAGALDRDKYDVVSIDFTGDLAPIVALNGQVDVVFLALHGPGGEDGRMQGVLDLLGLPYTGSGVLGSALAMHKGMAKRIYQAAGVPTPEDVTLYRGAPDPAAQVRATVGLPCVVKPVNEGSTFGISIVREDTELAPALEEAFRYCGEVIAECFVQGVEISVPVLGADPCALPAIEIIPKSGFYDYEMKYTPGATEEICPARISPLAAERAGEYAVRAHRALGCYGVSRTDFIVVGDEPVALETNSLPGMTATSLLPLSARVAGIAFADLLDRLIGDALSAGRV